MSDQATLGQQIMAVVNNPLTNNAKIGVAAGIILLAVSAVRKLAK